MVSLSLHTCVHTYVPLRLDASANEGRRTEVVYVDW